MKVKTRIALGQYLLEQRAITEEQLAEALVFRSKHNCKIGQALLTLEMVDERMLIEALRAQGNVDCIQLRPEVVDTKLALEFGENFSRRYRAVVVNHIAGSTSVAMEDPSNLRAIEEISDVVGTKILPLYAEASRINDTIRALFSAQPTTSATTLETPDSAPMPRHLVQAPHAHVHHAAPATQSPAAPNLLEPVRVHQADVNEVPIPTPTPTPAQADVPMQMGTASSDGVVAFLKQLLQEAFLQGIEELHIEPSRSNYLVRCRQRARLFRRYALTNEWGRSVISRFKQMARLDARESRTPQEGRGQFRYNGRRIDLRVVCVPTVRGEGVVVTLFDGALRPLGLDQLGLEELQLSSLTECLTASAGLVLVAAPPGHGLTSTQYALLQDQDVERRKIVTIEGSVDIELEGATQIHAGPHLGMTFANALRTVSRFEPDVLVLESINDRESAELVLQAALTGTQVIAGIDARNSTDAIAKMLDFGVESYLLAEVLRCVIGQRLVRRLCDGCLASVPADEQMLRELGVAAGVFFEAAGCDICSNRGFVGRMGLFEVLKPTLPLRDLIQRKASMEHLLREAQMGDLISLRECGVRRALEGRCAIHEVFATTPEGGKR